MSGDLAFNINYPVTEVACVEAGCSGCRAVHRRHTGDATLTVTGSIAAVQHAASLIIPGWPVTPEAPTADTDQCSACGAAFEVTGPMRADRCPECVAGGWFPEGGASRKALTAADLNALPATATVIAGAAAVDRRRERVRWTKLHSGRWIDGGLGRAVSAAWLANNRRPTPDDESESV